MRLFKKSFDITDTLIGLMIGLFVLIILYVSIIKDYITNNLSGTTQMMANIAVWFMFIAVALTAIYSAIKRSGRKSRDITDTLIGLMIGLFVLIILYVSIIKDYITNNLSGTTQMMANIAVWFMFIAVALTAIYSAVKRGRGK